MSLFRKDYKEKSDEELMAALVSDENAAFEELYDRYSKKMLNYFYRLLDDADKAQDFMHDLFMKIIERPEQFDSKRKFSTWFYAVATNMCRNEFRSQSTRVRIHDDLKMNGTLAEENHAAEKMDYKIFDKVLKEQLEEMSEDHRAIFILRFKEELSIKEISDVMNCPEGTVKSRIFYSLKKLTEQLQPFNPAN